MYSINYVAYDGRMHVQPVTNGILSKTGFLQGPHLLAVFVWSGSYSCRWLFQAAEEKAALTQVGSVNF